MLNIVIDNLYRLEDIGIYFPGIIQVTILLLWILITKKSKIRYQVSISLSLFLLLLGMIALILTFTQAAFLLGEYAFLFLGVGIIQMYYLKQESD